MLGKKDREKLQQAARDRQSGDPAKQQAAQQDVDELSKKAAQKDQDRQRARELARQADDLTSDDPRKRQAAEQKFDEALGPESREQLQDALNDLKSDDPQRRQAGRDKLRDMAKQARTQDGSKQAQQPGERPSPEQMKELADAAKDLNSPDTDTREAAERKLDDAIGPENREKAQRLANDLNSPDADTREAAEKQLQDMAKQTGQQGAELKSAKRPSHDRQDGSQHTGADKPGERPSPEQMKELADAAKDLNSPDTDTREAAERKLDDAIGPENREKAQRLANDLNSPDADTREAAEKQLQDMAKQGRDRDRAEQAQRRLEEQARELAEKAKDLASDDPRKREAAERALDERIGQENRERMQDAMKDMASGDPARAAEGRKKLEDLARDAAGQFDKDFRSGGSGSATGGREPDPLDGDPLNRLRTAELRLRDFEKAEYNEELKKRLGYSEGEFAEFVKSYREMVERLRNEVELVPDRPDAPPAAAPKLRIGESGEAQFRPDAASTPARAAGVGSAPPGYAEAQRRFAEEAAKLKPKK